MKEILSARVIQPSHSSYSSPTLLVRMANGTWWLYVDYRALNKVTMMDKFSIPIVKDILDELSRSTIFSKLYLKSGYQKI